MPSYKAAATGSSSPFVRTAARPIKTFPLKVWLSIALVPSAVLEDPIRVSAAVLRAIPRVSFLDDVEITYLLTSFTSPSPNIWTASVL